MKIKEIKIREDDGSYSDAIPVGTDGINVDMSNGNNLETELNNIKNNINEKANQITNLENKDTELNNKINSNNISLQNQINSLASGSPKGVYASVNALKTANPDTGVYIVTANGHIYSWTKDSTSDPVDLGVYQAVEVADNAIDIFKLDKTIQTNFIRKYENVDLGETLDGYVRIINNQISINDTDLGYKHAVVDLDVNTIYNFVGFNFYAICGLAVVDSTDSNKIIYSTRSQSSEGESTTSVNLIFKTKKYGLKAYISLSRPGGDLMRNNNVNLSKISKIELNHKDNDELIPLYSKEGLFLSVGSQIGSTMVIQESDTSIYKVYKMNKGTKYKISSGNIWYVCGIILTDDKHKVLYKSSSTNLNTKEIIDYEFEAQQDGFIFLDDISDQFTSTISIVDVLKTLKDDIEVLKTKKPFYGKKWACMGDSLTDKATLGQTVKNYTDYVSEKLGLISTNYGHGGSGYRGRSAYNEAFYQIADTLDSDTDLITIFGSFNDAYLNPLNYGTIDDTTNETTFGCMNLTLDKLINNYPNAVIGIIIPTPWGSMCHFDTNKDKANDYVNGLIEICRRRSIPVLDLYHNSNLSPWNENNANLYFHGTNETDTTHPNTLGHKRISPQIVEFIKGLLY